ncbi:MAG: hypothetical protein LBU85_06195 [Treponema sp.]|nr:hypothetical protein [Treponema sp.]
MKRVSKLVLGVCLAIGLAIAFTGCSSAPSAPKVFDKTVPLEQSSTIQFQGCSIVRFDGKENYLSPMWSAHNSLGIKQVIIPAGTHVLSIYAESAGGSTIYQWESVPMSYEFLPGHTYAIGVQRSYSDFTALIIDHVQLNRELVPDTTRGNASPFEGVWESSSKKFQLIFAGDEYMLIYNGRGTFRGNFTYDKSGTNVILTQWGSYYSKEVPWFIYPSPIKVACSYDGTLLTYGTSTNDKFRRVE